MLEGYLKRDLEAAPTCGGNLFVILVEFIVSAILFCSIGSLSFLSSFCFGAFAHRRSNLTSIDNVDDGTILSVGLYGVTTRVFLFVLLGKEMRSWLYNVYIWVFRRAAFPLKRYKLWLPLFCSEMVYASCQCTFVFLVAPFLPDSVLTSVAVLIVTWPALSGSIWPFKKNLTSSKGFFSCLNTTVTKRTFNLVGFVLNVAALILLSIYLKDDSVESYLESSNVLPNISKNGFIALTCCTVILMSISCWMNFISMEDQDHIRGIEFYDVEDSDGAAEYELQIFPIFAITGVFRILITYVFWQCVRNAVQHNNQQSYGPDHLNIQFFNGRADMASWFNICALVFFFSSLFLEWVSKFAVQSGLESCFQFGNILGSIASPLVFSFFDIDMREAGSAGGQVLYKFVLAPHSTADSVLFYIYLAMGTVSVFFTTAYLFTDNSFCFAQDRDVFLLPYFNPIFGSISFLLNRKRDDVDDIDSFKQSEEKYTTAMGNTPTLFICTTLWHEEYNEMSTLLKSLVTLCHHNYKSHKSAQKRAARSKTDEHIDGDTYNFYNLEIHIIFDDVMTLETSKSAKKSLNKWVDQFCEILWEKVKTTSDIHYENMNPTVVPTPYGGRIELKVCDVSFVIHLKDKDLTKNGKRWSQVMYLNYLVKYKINVIKEEKINHYSKNHPEGLYLPISAKNSYIMALDGDVAFKPESLRLVLDRLERNSDVAAACNQIKPTGNGWLVWFQRFEYAVGHWLQKTTEHVLGCVLCSPGCFSIVRCSFLTKEVFNEPSPIDIYKSHAQTPRQKLMYDQGEDRWLCTRILLAGGRIEFEGASYCDTFAPEDLDTFYKQRRRWGPSTTANIYELIDKAKLARKNRNISIFYVSYHAISMALSLVGASTTALMIAQGLEFGVRGGTISSDLELSVWNLLWPKLIVFTPIILYVIFCWFEWARDYQLKLASFFSLLYSFLMIYVFVALIVQGARCPWNPTFLFFASLAGMVIIAGLFHGDLGTLLCGLVYWACIPSCFIFLQIYSIANLNDCSWGTRQGGGNKSKKTPIDTMCDSMKLCCGTCCKCPVQVEHEADDSDHVESKKSVRFEINQLPHSALGDDPRISDLIESVHDKAASIIPEQPTVDLDCGEMNGELNKIFKNSGNQNFINTEMSAKDQLSTWRSSTETTYRGIDSIENHQQRELNKHDALFWMKSSTCPNFFNDNPLVEKLGPLEYKFWLGMVDPKYGYIRHFGKDVVEAKEIEEKAAVMTEEMQSFRDNLYAYYIYINVFWIVICTVAQAYSSEWTINILSRSDIDNLLGEDVLSKYNVTDCGELEELFQTNNDGLSTVQQENIIMDCQKSYMCRNSLERGFPPLEFFFLLFYLILITLQFFCMLLHRLQTLSHWLAYRSSKDNFFRLLQRGTGLPQTLKRGKEDYEKKSTRGTQSDKSAFHDPWNEVYTTSFSNH